ncbi:MAG: hypothetical protein UZ04_CHB001000232 [Chlorobi bacterium OLB4]|jgi:hypothetical protein|nr:MAG: hypothetical protein UZ04_CHB001000232 [Chlorobi bacterium OLB4]MBW7854874.1 hypothetical protein [Ignavibacteria bacterium]OQY78455.1 MAG: hypothetical protein B6D43_03015 [Ignavibacteriales bacterium UTCHB1]
MESVKLKIALCSKALESGQISHDPRIQSYFKTGYGAVITTAIDLDPNEPASGKSVEYLNSVKQSMAINFQTQSDLSSKLSMSDPGSHGLNGVLLCLSDSKAFFKSTGNVKLLRIRSHQVTDLSSENENQIGETVHYKNDIFIICSDSLLRAAGSASILDILRQNDPANCCTKILRKAESVSPERRYFIQIINILSGNAYPVEFDIPGKVETGDPELKKTHESQVYNKVNNPNSVNSPVPSKSRNSGTGTGKNKILYGIIILLLVVLLVVIIMNMLRKDNVNTIATNIKDSVQIINSNDPVATEMVNENFITNILKNIYTGKNLSVQDVKKFVESAGFKYRGSRSTKTTDFNVASFVSNVEKNNLKFENLESLKKEGESFKATYVINFNGELNKFEMTFTEAADGRINIKSIVFIGKLESEEKPTEVITETPSDTSKIKTEPTTRDDDMKKKLDTIKKLPVPKLVTDDDTTGGSITPQPKKPKESKDTSKPKSGTETPEETDNE